jgi:CHAT domain-containing protein/tetratricopeptide (TPR) repeat protein
MDTIRRSAGWALAVLLGAVGPGELGAAAPPIGQTGQANPPAPTSDIDSLLAAGTKLYEQGSAPSLRQAIPLLERALQLSRGARNADREALALLALGRIHSNLGDNPKALDYYEQALPILQSLGNRNGEATALNNIASMYSILGDKRKALGYLNQTLPILRALGNRSGEARALNNIGSIYSDLGEKRRALEFFYQALPLRRDGAPQEVLRQRSGEATTLTNIGAVYSNLGEQTKALEFYNQALPLHRLAGDRQGEASTLINIGGVYSEMGDQQTALKLFNQALPIYQFLGDRSGAATTLNNIGGVYSDLGETPKSLEFYTQALALLQSVGDRKREAVTLNNIGGAYKTLGDQQKALEYYNQVLPLYRSMGDRRSEATTLNNLGTVYSAGGDKQKALGFYNQALPLMQAVGNRRGEALILNNIGGIYNALGDRQQALAFYHRALPIRRSIADRRGEAKTLSSIGSVLNRQNQPELAIVFYKQSVSVYEAIRASNQALPRDLRESQTQTFAGAYRQLADLLLAQNRVLEAQQVLDLLKVQELNDYLKNVRSSAQALYELTPEQAILKKYNALQTTAIGLGQELTGLQTKAKKGGLSAADEQRKAQLVALQDELNQQFNRFTDSAEVQALVRQLSPTALRQTVDLTSLDAFRSNLRQLNAVMIYPLVLPDRLELILTTPDSPPLRRTVNVKQADLNRAIALFRSALQDPRQDATIPAQQLYQWLIKPLEADLKQAQAQTIIYAPDDQLRYIPLAALHNGQQWLIQQYQVNNITARSLTEFKTQPISQPHVLAGAFVTGNYTVRSGSRSLSFAGLPAAGVEVNTLADLLPGTTKLVDQAFSRSGTTSKMNDYNIVHFATHASFVPGSATDSFILFGNGETASLKDVESWTLNQVDLVVLSACETGLGGKFGNGEEILGLGYQFQNRGAKAVISSLWRVNDGGTQALMDAFYGGLKTGQLTKAAALQQAQRALINPSTQTAVGGNFTHPYYWAPFILIGNGL